MCIFCSWKQAAPPLFPRQERGSGSSAEPSMLLQMHLGCFLLRIQSKVWSLLLCACIASQSGALEPLGFSQEEHLGYCSMHILFSQTRRGCFYCRVESESNKVSLSSSYFVLRRAMNQWLGTRPHFSLAFWLVRVLC